MVYFPEPRHFAERFTSVLAFTSEGGRLIPRLQSQPRLRRNFELYRANHPEFALLCDRPSHEAETELALFWRDLAINGSPDDREAWESFRREQLAIAHLISFFERTCCQVVNQSASHCPELPIEDSLSILRGTVGNEQQLKEWLEKYDPQRGALLETYIHQILRNTLKAELNFGRVSKWRRFYKTSEEDLKYALEMNGYREPQITQFLWGRKIFKKVYLINHIQSPTRISGSKWLEPKLEDFQEAANCFNAERILPSVPLEISSYSIDLSALQLKRWMENCWESLRQTNSNTLISTAEIPDLETPDSPDSLDTLETPPSLFSGFSDSQLEQELNQCKNILKIQIGKSSIPVDPDKVLFLYYGINLTQSDIGKCLEIQQYKISRLVARYKRRLAKCLKQSSNPDGWILQYVRRWLRSKYPTADRSDLIEKALIEAVEALDSEDRRFLGDLLRRDPSFSSGFQEESLNSEELATLEKIENQLKQQLLYELEGWIDRYINSWLECFYRNALNTLLQEVTNSDLLETLTIENGSGLSHQDGKAKNYNTSISLEVLELYLQNWLTQNLGVYIENLKSWEKISRILSQWLEQQDWNQYS
ncbi:hypothetical protein [Oxynema aestuarii]|uniref:Uncharacterized protein n=1 Tax=Oxynema aestuarii AP17 TaxID=2064643 RepID=A0A6H1TWW3_9CYAN|nr:hypothetical protein [Oxynema aestuarii]QIZ69829.1 hypothetical protein HCG48_03895 [Oxynema aestuarii AP17]